MYFVTFGSGEEAHAVSEFKNGSPLLQSPKKRKNVMVHPNKNNLAKKPRLQLVCLKNTVGSIAFAYNNTF